MKIRMDIAAVLPKDGEVTCNIEIDLTPGEFAESMRAQVAMMPAFVESIKEAGRALSEAANQG